MGKYLARVRIERSEVRGPRQRAKYFPVWPTEGQIFSRLADLSESISILSYHHCFMLNFIGEFQKDERENSMNGRVRTCYINR